MTSKEQKAQITILLHVWIIHLRNVGLQLLGDGSLEPTFTIFFLIFVLLTILSVWFCMCASPFLPLTLHAYRHWNHLSVYSHTHVQWQGMLETTQILGGDLTPHSLFNQNRIYLKNILMKILNNDYNLIFFYGLWCCPSSFISYHFGFY